MFIVLAGERQAFFIGEAFPATVVIFGSVGDDAIKVKDESADYINR